MRIPGESSLNVQSGVWGRVSTSASESLKDGIAPQGCGVLKGIGCAVRVAAAAGICYASLGTACLTAVASLGGCCDCLPKAIRKYCP
jgi:hypothetical protein